MGTNNVPTSSPLKADLEHRQRFLNGRNTLLTLLRLGVIPIVNENDTVAFEEIKFGDNDTLAALVGTLIDADLVILSVFPEWFWAAPANSVCPSPLQWRRKILIQHPSPDCAGRDFVDGYRRPLQWGPAQTKGCAAYFCGGNY